jgi:hypothetical protein
MYRIFGELTETKMSGHEAANQPPMYHLYSSAANAPKERGKGGAAHPSTSEDPEIIDG